LVGNVEKHGAEFLRLSRFHTGPWAGELLVTTRYSSWEVYGKVQEAVAKDPEFAQVQADGMKIAELHGRRIKKAAANHAPQKNPFFLSWQVIFADLWNRSIL